MATQHTPGPWHVHNDGPDRTYYICDYAQDSPSYGGNAIAKVVPVSSDDHHQANAHLIAAAPDLLRACGNMNDALVLHGILRNEVCSGAGDVTFAFNQMAVAIAKAQGGAQ